jgi:hypothetical protein
MDSTTTNIHQSQSCCEPLHSNSISPSSPQSMSMSMHLQRHPSSSSSSSSRYFSTFFLITLLLTLSSLPESIEAKYRLIPKRRTKTQPQNNKQEQTQSMFHRDVNTHTQVNQKANSKPKDKPVPTPNSPLIVLKPKKKQISAQNLKLDAQIHTNEDGEQVLLLTPESSQMVHSAMGSGSQSETVSLDVIPQQVESAKMEMASGTDGSKAGASTNDVGAGHQVLFYDPEDLKTKPGEEPLPKRVFDENGKEVDMTGKDALLVKPHLEDEQDKVSTLQIIKL